MEDGFDSYNDKEDYTASLDRFEKMLSKNEEYFFDVEEFEILVDHYLDKSDTSKAKQVIDISLLQHPTSSNLKLKKAHFLAATHQPNKALQVLNNLEDFEPFNAEIYTTKATIHSQLRQHNKAIENFYKALKLIADKSEKANIKINIAFEYENLNEFDKAIDILKGLLKENPENETVLYELAFCYNLKNDTDNSILFFKDFIDDYPYSYAAWYNLGIALSRAGLFEKAIEAYDYTIAIKEDFASAYFNKANSLALLEQYENAINTYRETFEYEDPDATTFYYIGECYEKLGNPVLAMSNYYKSTKMDPFHADAWAGMAVINETEDKSQSAVFYIKKALELENNNSEYWYIYGDILAKIGMFDEALISFNKVIEYDEENDEIWLDKAEVIKNNENLENAIVTLYKGLEKQPTNNLIYARLVPYLLMNGKIDEALLNLTILLTNDQELVSEIVEFYPETLSYQKVIDLIENFKNK